LEFVITEKKDGVGIITLNRPKVMNALSSALLKELSETFTAMAEDSTIQTVIMTGAGKAFAAGADVSEMVDYNTEQARAYGALGQKVFRKIEKMEKPTIAAINGFALGGGCELALACDMRICGRKANFGQPEVTLGITPGFSGTQRLPRLIGKAHALEMILTGDMIDAEKALAVGLVNKVVDDEDLMDEAMKLAGKIARNAPLAVRYSNLAVKRGLGVDIDSGISIEAEFFGMCFATSDQKKGMRAFLNKEKVRYDGK
jgi:enoyl-CoA hydratase